MTNTQRQSEVEIQVRQKTLPLFKVIVWNDEIHSTVEVTIILMRIFRLDVNRAKQIMWCAHKTGRAVCLTNLHIERAELYCVQLHSYGLTASIEPA